MSGTHFLTFSTFHIFGEVSSSLGAWDSCVIFYIFFIIIIIIQFNVPFKIISLIETSQSIGGANGSTPGKPPDTPQAERCVIL